MSNLLTQCVNCFVSEKFTDVKSGPYEMLARMRTTHLISAAISIVIVYALLLLFGKFLWNNFLVKVSNSIKPIDSIWTLLGITILIKMIFP